MAISYSGEGYKFQPQFANLSALQGLQPLDVTRRAQFETRPLTYAEIPSSRPEIVSEGFSKGILAAVGGITEGITAKYKSEQALEEKGIERAHQIELAKLKAKEYDPYIESLKTRKLELETDAINKRIEGTVPAGATPRIPRSVDTELPTEQTSDSTNDKIDLTLTPPEWVNASGKTSSIQENDISSKIAEQAKGLEGISAKFLTASTDSGVGVLAPIDVPKKEMEQVPSMQLGKISTGLISPEQEKEIESKFEAYGVPSVLEKTPQKTLLSLEKAQPKKEVKVKLPESGDVDTEEQAQQMAYGEIEGFKPGTYQQLIDENGVPFFRVPARIKMSRAEIAAEQKAMSEAEKAAETGVNFKTEQDLRNEYLGQTKDFKTIQSAWRSIKTSGTPSPGKEPSGAGDMALIFGFMKLLDPGSTVREGEYATAQNVGNIPQRIVGIYNALITGEGKLDPNVRADFLEQSKKQYNSRLGEYSGLKKSYTELAKQYNLNPERVVVSFDLPEEVTKEKTEQNRKQQLESQLNSMQAGTPEYQKTFKELVDIIKAEKTAQKPTPQATVKPTQQSTFQPAVPRQPQQYGETLESFLGNK